MVEDQLIIELFFERSEKAISELSKKYGKRCLALSMGILNNEEDAEECVNDAYLAVWDQIPPLRPDYLGAYVARITRNLSLNRFHANIAKKRNSHYDVCIEELAELIQNNENLEARILAEELKNKINSFLERQEKKDRIIFVERFWFCKECDEIAKDVGKSKNYVNVHLHRTKTRLKKYLKSEDLI